MSYKSIFTTLSFWFWATLVLLVPLWATEGSPVFTRLGHEHGLANSSVSSIIQDDSGFLWFGTQAGLQRYDGHEMVLYTSEPFADNQLSHHLVQTVHYSGGDVLWVGTYGGLNRLDTATQQIASFTREAGNDRSLSNDVVVAVAEDAAGTVWVGTLDGLNRLDDAEGGVFTRYRPDVDDPTALPHATVRSLHLDSRGTLWVGSIGGLSRVETGSDGAVSFSTRVDDLPSEPVMDIAEDSAGNLWVGTWDGGVVRIRRDGRIDRRYSFPDNRIYQIMPSQSGLVYVATWGGGLVVVDPDSEHFEVFQADEQDRYSIAHNVIYSLAEDRSGIIWIGTNGNGVSKLDPQRRDFRFIHPDLPAGTRLPPGKINVLYYDDPTDALYIGVQQGGLHIRDPDNGSLQSFRHDPEDPHSLTDNQVNAILRYDGRLLLATNSGVSRFDRATGRFEQVWAELFAPGSRGTSTAPIVYALLQSDDGSLWAGTYNSGVVRRRPDGEVVRYASDDDDESSLTDNLVYTIHTDAHGRIWVGTNRGLNRYVAETDSFVQYVYDPDNPSGISDNTVVQAMNDSSERLWFATRSGGLMRYREESDSFDHTTMADGLSSNLVRSVVEQTPGVLYVATANGLNRYDVGSGDVTIIDERDGLPTREFSSNGIRLPTGELLFGGFATVLRVPVEIAEGVGTPPIAQVTEISIMGEPLDADRSHHLVRRLELPHTDNTVGFRYVALEFSSPHRNFLQYRLVGFSSEWTVCDGSRSATYTNLRPGRYTFEVMAADSRGVLAESPAQIEIVIAPPFWRTWWFALIASAVVVVAAWFVLVVRTRRLINRARLLESQVSQRTTELSRAVESLQKTNAAKDRFFSLVSHDLRGPISGMARLLRNVVEHPAGYTVAQLHEITGVALDTAEGMHSMLDNLLEWSRLQSGRVEVEPQRVPVAELVHSVFVAYAGSARSKSVTLVCECDERARAWADIHALRTIVENLVNNAVKFSNTGGDVTVRCSEIAPQSAPQIRLEVIDHGVGIPDDKLCSLFAIDKVVRTHGTSGETGSGLGLTLCHELVTLLGGTISVASVLGRGTTVTLKLPAAAG